MSVSKKLPARSKSCKNAKDEILRPRTAYNFFYSYQRHLILKSKASCKLKQQEEATTSLMINSFFLSSDPSRRNRPHRKTHGLISLQQLTKTVAKRWKEADTKTRNKFIALAEQDKIRHKNETLARPAPWMQPYDIINDHTRFHYQPNDLLLQNNNMPQPQREDIHFPMYIGNPSNIQNVRNYPFTHVFSHCDHSAYEPIDFTGRSESRPSYYACDHTIPVRVESNESGLSAEEYDMLELLIRE